MNRPLDLETRVELLWDSPHGPDMHVAASAGVLESIRAVRGELFGETVVYEFKRLLLRPWRVSRCGLRALKPRWASPAHLGFKLHFYIRSPPRPVMTKHRCFDLETDQVVPRMVGGRSQVFVNGRWASPALTAYQRPRHRLPRKRSPWHLPVPRFTTPSRCSPKRVSVRVARIEGTGVFGVRPTRAHGCEAGRASHGRPAGGGACRFDAAVAVGRRRTAHPCAHLH